MKNKKIVAWRELLTNKFFDLLIVITGVTIAFQLNNWKLGSDQESLASFYKENIKLELTKDIEEQEFILRTLESDKRVTESFLASHKPTPDSLVKIVLAVLSLETFTPHQNTYQTLLQGNGLLTDLTVAENIALPLRTHTNLPAPVIDRLVALKLPDRIQAYQDRIAELERDLGTRGDELRELTQATVNKEPKWRHARAELTTGYHPRTY